MTRGSFLQRLKMKSLRKESTQQTTFSNTLTKNLDENLNTLRQLLGEPTDLVVRELMIGSLDKRAGIIYISGLSDEKLINNNILKSIQLNLKEFETKVLEKIHKEVTTITDVEKTNQLDVVSL